MNTPYFLGWHEPFINLAVEWLWARKDDFAQMLVVVPTNESGRKVRQALAEKGPCLVPRFCTAGKFGALGYQGEENPLLEQLIWEQTLQDNWHEAKDLFPTPQAEHFYSALAEELRTVRVKTGEYGYTFTRVWKKLPEDHPDKTRWGILSSWERNYFKTLKSHGANDSFEVRNIAYRSTSLPNQASHIVLLGVTDPTEQAVRMAHACAENGVTLSTLIAAPESEAACFDSLGRPLTESWSEKKLHWKGGNEQLHAVTNPSSLPALLHQHFTQIPAGESIGLGIGDKEIAPIIKTELAKRGVTIFDPAGTSMKDWSFVSWFKTWLNFCSHERIEDLRILTRSPWTQKLTSTYDLYFTTKCLEDVTENAKPHNVSDLWHLKKSGWPFDQRYVEEQQRKLNRVLDLLSELSPFQKSFKKVVSLTELRTFLEKVLTNQESAEITQAEKVFLTLEEEGNQLPEYHRGRFNFSREFLKRLEAERLGQSREKIQLEALGWLELAFESAEHLFITGLNEGVLPNTELGDSWLPDSLRNLLGMRTNRTRFAHDCYYLTSLLEARRATGQVYGYFLKFGLQEDPVKPSRLILQVPTEQLAERVEHCFKESSFTLPTHPWQREWSLTVPPPQEVTKLSPTKIRQYLTCPFRFYLKHVLHMQRPDDNIQEWSHREFGNIVHQVLENMQKSPSILSETNPQILEHWLHEEMDQLINARFASTSPLAFQIQRESMKQRFTFFAQKEVAERTNSELGWTTIAWEKSFVITVEGIPISGTIDRIDKHTDGSVRLVDYKTGRVETAKKSHVKAVGRNGAPPHLEDTPIVFKQGEKLFYWTDLQLPIYALYYFQTYNICPQLAYCKLGDSAENTGYEHWDFSEDELNIATKSLEAVITAIKKEIYWPPAEVKSYMDDFAQFGLGYDIEEGFTFHESPTETIEKENQQPVETPILPEPTIKQEFTQQSFDF